MNKDYYKILGVDRNASDQEIRKAFLKLSKKYHPDMQSGKTDAEKKEAEEKFKELNEANEVLSNKEKREYYNNFGSTPGQNQRGGFGAGGIDPREFFRRHANHFSHFDSFGADFGFGHHGFKTNNPPDPTLPKNGKDIRIQVKFKLEDILYGSTREFTIKVNDPCIHCRGTGAKNGEMKKCPNCDGTGMQTSINGHMIMQTNCQVCGGVGFIASDRCEHCNNGFVESERKLSISIPQGFEEGNKLRVKGEGQKGINGGTNGDIYIVVLTEEHELFKRNGNDLISEIYISPITAILGGDIEVQTPWGLATLSIPKGIEDGKHFRLSKQGIKNGIIVGDFYVIIYIETIKNLTNEQIKILNDFNKLVTDNNFNIITKQKEKQKQFFKENKKHISKDK